MEQALGPERSQDARHLRHLRRLLALEPMLIEHAESQLEGKVELSPCISGASEHLVGTRIPVQRGDPRLQRQPGRGGGPAPLLESFDSTQAGGRGVAITSPQARPPRKGLLVRPLTSERPPVRLFGESPCIVERARRESDPCARMARSGKNL